MANDSTTYSFLAKKANRIYPDYVTVIKTVWMPDLAIEGYTNKMFIFEDKDYSAEWNWNGYDIDGRYWFVVAHKTFFSAN